MLVSQLPRDSALAQALDPDLANWSPTEELLALVAELVDKGNRLFIRAHTDRSASQPEPLRIPRPGRQAEIEPPPGPKPGIDVEAIRSFFGTAAVYVPAGSTYTAEN